jgi:C-terminal processing protease CtpA/Prc
MDYKFIINKLVSTIEKNGIKEKLNKWKKPNLKYDFDNREEFYSYISKLARSYDKHTFIINNEEEEEYFEKNPINKYPTIKIIKNNILVIKFYSYSNYSKEWKKDLDNWVDTVKRKIDKNLEKKPNGIIIDLTEHEGGNMWSAIRAMSNIYGNTTLLKFTSEKQWINTIDGQEKGGDFISKNLKFKKPIVIIVSSDTASSGELIGATFKGRKNTYFIGDNTNKSGGFMSVNNGYYIDKNKSLNLILTISFVETVDKKEHILEYLKVKNSKFPIEDSIKKIQNHS